MRAARKGGSMGGGKKKSRGTNIKKGGKEEKKNPPNDRRGENARNRSQKRSWGVPLCRTTRDSVLCQDLGEKRRIGGGDL